MCNIHSPLCIFKILSNFRASCKIACNLYSPLTVLYFVTFQDIFVKKVQHTCSPKIRNFRSRPAFGRPRKMDALWVEIKYLKSSVMLFIKLNPIGPCLGFSNKILYILVAKGTARLPEVKFRLVSRFWWRKVQQTQTFPKDSYWKNATCYYML